MQLLHVKIVAKMCVGYSRGPNARANHRDTSYFYPTVRFLSVSLMPLTYQGSVSKKLPRSPGTALEHAHALLQPVGYQVTDIRLVYETLEALTVKQASFPGKKNCLARSFSPPDRRTVRMRM